MKYPCLEVFYDRVGHELHDYRLEVMRQFLLRHGCQTGSVHRFRFMPDILPE